jgi:hypothetical protein
MHDDATPLNIPAPLTALFEIVSDAFDALEESTGEEVALDIFFEEVEFEGEDARLCLTVNDLVSAYHEGDKFTVVLTIPSDDEEDAHPWFRRDTPEAAAERIVRFLVDAEFLTEDDAAIMIAAMGSSGEA